MQMNKKKIFNDPVYGFITVPYEIVFDLIEHPYFQRLRRISQLGLTHYIYPGALHTRFHHALGSLHLMSQAISILRSKGVKIEEEEAEAVSIAILLHDIGHGPYSHALENVLIETDHEQLSRALMTRLNQQFNGVLLMALKIFTDQYHKRFLHQLISSQLDMDRLDYLNRDSFYSGVMEGKIGYDRIIKMLHVVDDSLVVEEKGIYSIEKFLIARRLMYLQVYLHKAVLSAEKMLIKGIRQARKLICSRDSMTISPPLRFLLTHSWSDPDVRDAVLDHFVLIDDFDVMMLLKMSTSDPDFIFQLISNGLTHRRLFKVELQNQPFTRQYTETIRRQVATYYKVEDEIAEQLVMTGSESTKTYNEHDQEIGILLKTGQIKPLPDFSEYPFLSRNTDKHYICYPRVL